MALKISGMNLNFKGNILNVSKQVAQKPVKSEAENPEDIQDIKPKKISQDKIYNKKGELNPVLTKMLDESKFVFETDEGSKLMTIKDSIKNNIINSRHAEQNGMYHATSTREIGDKIIKEGFSPNHISRTKYGPGFYFAYSEGEALNYGTAKLQVDIEGEMAVMKPSWYSEIEETSVTDKIKQFTGATGIYETRDILKDYVRNLMMEEMGFDFVYCNGHLVCFNPDVIKNIRHF